LEASPLNSLSRKLQPILYISHVQHPFGRHISGKSSQVSKSGISETVTYDLTEVGDFISRLTWLLAGGFRSLSSMSLPGQVHDVTFLRENDPRETPQVGVQVRHIF
jgi:hypothetical protein